MHRAPSEVDPAKMLLARRAAIDTVATTIEDLGPDPDFDLVAAAIGSAIAAPPLDSLAGLHGGPSRLIDQSLDEYRRFTPSAASNASSPAGMVRILLLQNLDLLWWDDTADLESATDIAHDPELVNLRAERRAGRVRFGFGVAPKTLLGRGRDFLRHRLRPTAQPQGPGLSFTRVRPEMIGVLNEIADTTHQRAPQGTPPIWVTSITRSVEHQNHLRSLGFSALNPSAHCRGWAADIEVSWFEQFDAAEVLKTVLLEYLEHGVLNVIDEGRAWHICLSPLNVPDYQQPAR